MNGKERLEEIKSRVWKDKGTYAMGDYSQREGYIYTLSDYDYEWLIEQAERVEELEKQRNERTQLLNAEVARNVRYKKVLEKIVNHAGKGIDIDYELWKMAKRALEGEE